MADSIISGVSVRGISTCVPPGINSISDYSLFTPSERENFIKSVGVRERRFSDKNVCSSDLALSAAEKLISSLQWEKDSIDGLIMVTQSPDYLIPATAIILQNRLGLSKQCMAFDINLGCSGYVIGLQTASGLIGKNSLKRVLLLAADVPSANLSYYDKAVYPLFGDAGTATAIEYDENASSMYFKAESDGSDFDALYIPDGGVRNIAGADSFIMEEFEDGTKRNRTHIIIDGMRIFNFSITKVPPQIRDVLELAQTDIDSTDYFFTHQANLIINETIRKKLKIPPEKFPYSISMYGNTSSASIPLTICHILGSNTDSFSGNCILSGFGIGLSWATAWCSFKNTRILPIHNYEY